MDKITIMGNICQIICGINGTLVLHLHVKAPDLIECPCEKRTQCIHRHPSEHAPQCGHMVWVALSRGVNPDMQFVVFMGLNAMI